MVFICDNADGRARARYQKFNQWSEMAEPIQLRFTKIDFRFGTEQKYYFTSLIMRFDSPRMGGLITAFQQLSADYNRTDK